MFYSKEKAMYRNIVDWKETLKTRRHAFHPREIIDLNTSNMHIYYNYCSI